MTTEERRVMEEIEALPIEQRLLMQQAMNIQAKLKRSNEEVSKTEVERTSSLKRHKLDVREKTQDEENDLSCLYNKTASSSTSYFLDRLEESRVKSREIAKNNKILMTSRAYTFNQEPIETELVEVDEKDPISGQELSKRYFSHENLIKMFQDIKVLRLNKLFAKVTPPDFEEPKYANWCVLGIISEKTKPAMSNSLRGKNERYVKLKITDFKYDMDITIWGSVIGQYNKLRIGDIVAILNPAVFVKHGSGLMAGGVRQPLAKTFGLSLRHGNSILEIGRSKNFGYCKSKLYSTGLQCKNYIDTSKNQYCSYHNEAQLNKTAGGRMEFQNSHRLNSYVKNGIKQSMYLGKPDGKVRLEIINDRSAPKMDYVSRQRNQFSSDEAHANFFKDRYEDEKEKKKEEKYKKDKNQIIKELELRKKLSENFKEGSKLKNLENKKELKHDLKTMSKVELLKSAFTAEQLSRIGFDPSSKSNERGLLSIGRGDKDILMKEFREITKNKKVNLKLDEQEIKKRQQMNKENEVMMKRLRNKRYEKYNKIPEKEESSEEELEIEEKSFLKFKQLKSKQKESK